MNIKKILSILYIIFIFAPIVFILGIFAMIIIINAISHITGIRLIPSGDALAPLESIAGLVSAIISLIVTIYLSYKKIQNTNKSE